MNKSFIKKTISMCIVAVIACCNVAGVLAATQTPTKAPSTVIYDNDADSSSSSSKSTASAKPSSTAKSTASAKPASTDETTKSSSDESGNTNENVIVVSTATPDASLNITTSQDENNKNYVTNFGAFMWFLLTVIVSAVISFMISYRFYKMSRKDTHLTAEIRALRKDIDAKMQTTIGGFSESNISVQNNNPSYKISSSHIKSAQDLQEEEQTNEIYKKWETQLLAAQQRAEQTEHERNHIKNSNYEKRNTRKTDKNSNGVSKVVGNIKNAVNDIFPFNK